MSGDMSSWRGAQLKHRDNFTFYSLLLLLLLLLLLFTLQMIRALISAVIEVSCVFNKTKIKVEFSLCLTKHHAINTCWEVDVYIHVFLTSVPDGGE
jgi:hypothetical protein